MKIHRQVIQFEKTNSPNIIFRIIMSNYLKRKSKVEQMNWSIHSSLITVCNYYSSMKNVRLHFFQETNAWNYPLSNVYQHCTIKPKIHYRFHWATTYTENCVSSRDSTFIFAISNIDFIEFSKFLPKTLPMVNETFLNNWNSVIHSNIDIGIRGNWILAETSKSISFFAFCWLIESRNVW